MELHTVRHNGRKISINPAELDTLITTLLDLKKQLMPPPQAGEVREGYLDYHGACWLLNTLAPQPSRSALKYRIGRIWTACQRDPRYGSLPYDGYCTACGAIITDGWRHGSLCAPTANDTWRIAISKLSIVENRERFEAVTYRGVSQSVKEAYRLLADHFVAHGVT